MEKYWPMIIDYGLKVIGVIVLFIVAWILSKWISNLMTTRLEKRKFDKTLSRFLGKMVRWSILAVAVVACLGIFGVQTTSFAAVFGGASLAVGLAFQGSLSNFASGVMIIVFRPFSVDDVITVSGITGKVIEIGLFTCKLDTPDNRRMILPNKAVFASNIENVTFHQTRRVDVKVGTDYGARLDETRAVLEKAAAGVPGRLDDPAPQIVLSELGGSSVDWVVRVWCKTEDYWGIKEAVTNAVKLALDEAGIGIPFPQMDVHLDGAVAKSE